MKGVRKPGTSSENARLLGTQKTSGLFSRISSQGKNVIFGKMCKNVDLYSSARVLQTVEGDAGPD